MKFQKIKKKKPISKEKLMEDNMAYKRQSKKYFIGPATVSLERKHIVKNVVDDIPNINNLYTITEKADGVRQLFYISNNGKIYFLDINLGVKFIGCITKNKKLLKLLLMVNMFLMIRQAIILIYILCLIFIT